MKRQMIVVALLSTSLLYSQPAHDGSVPTRSEMSFSFQLNAKVRSTYLSSYSYAIPEISRNLELNMNQLSSFFLSYEIMLPTSLSRHSYFLVGYSLLSNAEGSSSIRMGRGSPVDTIASVDGYLNGGGLYVGLAVDPSFKVSEVLQAGLFMKLAVGLFSFDQKTIVNLKSGDHEIIPPNVLVHTISNVGSKLSFGIDIKSEDAVFRIGTSSYLASGKDAGLVRIAGIDLSMGLYF